VFVPTIDSRMLFPLIVLLNGLLKASYTLPSRPRPLPTSLDRWLAELV